VLAEFSPDLEVVFREEGGVRVTSLRELLPHMFDVQRLQVR
jgi:cytidine deaminase